MGAPGGQVVDFQNKQLNGISWLIYNLTKRWRAAG